MIRNIDENLQLKIKDLFLNHYKYDEQNKVINGSSTRKFFSDYPEIKLECEKILDEHQNFKNLNALFKCIVFDINLPFCKICGKELNFVQMMKGRDYCSQTCAQRNPELIQSNKEKRIKTNLKKYGCKNPTQNPEIIAKLKESFKKVDFKAVQAKIKQTNLERYGVDSYFKTAEFKEKSKNTCMEKYGTEYANQDEKVKEKIKNTYNQDKEEKQKRIQEKIKNNNLKKYGVTHHMKLEKYIALHNDIAKEQTWKTIQSYKDYIIPLFNREDVNQLRSGKIYKWKCVKCGHEFEDHIHRTMHIKELPYLPRCLKCYPYMSGSSSEEKELLNFIKSIYLGEVLENDRKLIKPYELDIVIPKLKIAFEFNGDHWHEEGISKPIGYHEMKIQLCKDKGYELIHVWEHDWIKDKENIFKNIEEKLFYLNKKRA